MDTTQFWVGILHSIHEVIVYDPEMQLEKNKNLYVYSI